MREAPRRRPSTATRGASAPPGGGILPFHPRPAPEHRMAPLGAIHGEKRWRRAGFRARVCARVLGRVSGD